MKKECLTSAYSLFSSEFRNHVIRHSSFCTSIILRRVTVEPEFAITNPVFLNKSQVAFSAILPHFYSRQLLTLPSAEQYHNILREMERI